MYLGIDIGTGSTKALLTDVEGHIIARAARSHRPDFPRPGHVEFDAEGVWWQEVISLCQELLLIHDATALRGVSVSALGPSLILTDSDFQPLAPAILYGVDTRADKQIDDLNDELGPQRILATSGSQLSSQSLGPKIRWMRDNMPDTFTRATHWFSASNFIVGKLTGEYVIDQHSASQTDPMHDLETGRWIDDHVSAITEHLAMPRLVWSAEQVGSVTAQTSALTGLPAGTPVTGGTIDAWAEAFSVGARRPGDLMLMYGSTFFFIQQLSQPARHPGLWATRGVEPGSFSMAAGMATSGSVVQWFEDLTGHGIEHLTAEAADVPAGSEGVMVLPYFSGERTPIFDPDARGTITGLTLSHGRGHILRAIYEGMACGVAQILELMASSTERPGRLVCVGGGVNSPLWSQIVSDVTGRVQEVPDETVGASYGDALMAAIAVGDVPPDTDWTRIVRKVTPNPEHTEPYRALVRTYTDAYPALRDTMHSLADRSRT